MDFFHKELFPLFFLQGERVLGRRLGIARIQIDGSSEQNGGLKGGFKSCGRATFPTKITQHSTRIRG